MKKRNKVVKTIKRETAGSAKTFWDKEYKEEGHFRLSHEPAEDLEKFVRWCHRNLGKDAFTKQTKFVDIGCGNGRNSIYLSLNFGSTGFGYDISEEAVSQARKKTKDLGLDKILNFEPRNLKSDIHLPDESCDYAIDMMASHVLRRADREKLLKEILRVLSAGSMLFVKTFLLDEDGHAKKMIRENPAEEPNSYIHPMMGIFEYVGSEEELREFYEPYFDIEKVEKSFGHRTQTKKRRSIIFYLRKKF